MRRGRASRTAELMALFRALESALPAGTRLFEDRFARHCLRKHLAFAVGLARVPGVARLLCRFIDRRWPGPRTSAVARTRFIDDAVRSALAGGVEQLVILGAGFDARAYRLPTQGVAVFEVDHPSTLAAKRRVLESVLGAPPAHVRFVETDFNLRELDAAMRAAGYRERRQTLFLWEGVTNYLTEAAVDATLAWCARAGPGSALIFTYVHRAVLEDPASFEGTERVFSALDGYREPWTFGLEPSQLADFLAKRGFRLERDLGASDYRALCYGDTARGMRGYEFYRLAVARVAEAARAQARRARSEASRAFGSREPSEVKS